MKKLFAVLSLCILFSMVPGMKVLAETQTAPGGEPQIQEMAEIKVLGSEMSQMYLKEYEAMARWEWVAIMGVSTFFGIALMVIMYHFFWPYDNLMRKKAIAIPAVIVALVCSIGSGMFMGKISDAEIVYKASAIKEISDAYAKDTGRLPIQGEYKGAGETNLLYELNIEEMSKYKVSIANMRLNKFFIEELTGKVYYRSDNKPTFIKPLES